ncbi:hypothetical protein ACFXTN_027734 [Malus domestica]
MGGVGGGERSEKRTRLEIWKSGGWYCRRQRGRGRREGLWSTKEVRRWVPFSMTVWKEKMRRERKTKVKRLPYAVREGEEDDRAEGEDEEGEEAMSEQRSALAHNIGVDVQSHCPMR